MEQDALEIVGETQPVTEQTAQPEQPQADNTEQPSADSSPASEETHEQNQNGVQERINKLTAKRYAAEREADAERKKNAELQAQIDKYNQKPSELVAPTLPDDIYDHEAMVQYHNDTTEYNRKVAEQAGSQAIENQNKTQQQQQQEAKARETITAYAENAIKAGISEEKLIASNKSLNDAGISPDLGELIMTDPNGGQIAAYLHDNPAMMQEVLNNGVARAAIIIETKVKPAALSTTPKVSGAPDPLPTFKGTGAEVKDDFESKNPGTVFI
ncbi:hypothetical protein PODOV084v1_p0006 [Vibrio phage 340E47.2]|nr:hypothetical protein PODOV084v1_p0006 [Vibrio phage 340E47.2]QZI91964.1 hypothetical protein PODOV077v1_p0053 [Vibrio phage 5P1a]